MNVFFGRYFKLRRSRFYGKFSFEIFMRLRLFFKAAIKNIFQVQNILWKGKSEHVKILMNGFYVNSVEVFIRVFRKYLKIYVLKKLAKRQIVSSSTHA